MSTLQQALDPTTCCLEVHGQVAVPVPLPLLQEVHHQVSGNGGVAARLALARCQHQLFSGLNDGGGDGLHDAAPRRPGLAGAEELQERRGHHALRNGRQPGARAQGGHEPLRYARRLLPGDRPLSLAHEAAPGSEAPAGTPARQARGFQGVGRQGPAELPERPGNERHLGGAGARLSVAEQGEQRGTKRVGHQHHGLRLRIRALRRGGLAPRQL
mmetsp:Transcript_80141/g.249021  ORF Transcript_80141/g.249021 Transcript_80141/m.249021 type:complete len:214 (+) Transcript_80141:859-1500(+)